MKQFIILPMLAAATLSANLAVAAPGYGNGPNNGGAGNGNGPNNGGAGNGNGNGNTYHAAPGPIIGAGPVGLVIGGIGYGIYWLRKRRRRAG